MAGTGSVSCPVMGFGTTGDEPSGSTTNLDLVRSIQTLYSASVLPSKMGRLASQNLSIILYKEGDK
jgi:hypothetical protein